jgi:hypothetical protein
MHRYMSQSNHHLSNSHPAHHEIRPVLRIALTLALTLGTTSSQATTVLIGDGTFNAGDWTSEVRFDAGLSSAATTIQQQSSGGSPGFYRLTSYSLTHSGQQTYGTVYVLNAFQGLTYTPSLEGAITSLGYAEDHTRLSASWSPSLVGAQPALVQDGKYYVGPGFNFGPADNSWQTHSATLLLASDFMELSGTTAIPGSYPDFGASGGTIAFGYARANSTSFSASLSHGIDDWRYTLTTVPEPSHALLLLGGLAAFGVRRRRA